MTRHHHYPPSQPQLTQPGGPHQPGECDLSQVTSDPPSTMGFGEPYTCHDNVLPPHYWAQPPQPMQTYPVPTGPVPAPIDAGPTAGMESTQNWDSTCSPSPNAAEDGDDDDHNGPIGDANESTEPKKKTRGKFTAEQRQKTAGTRKLKACIRCRMQRVRCIFDPNEPEGVCVTCKNVSKDSKKVIHRVPCLRYKLTETRMFRQGGLKLTRRWDAPQMRDITGWDNDDVRTIHITLGICDEPLVLNVRRFSPRNGDVLHRNWVDGPIKKRKDLEPYALANIVAASDAFTSYLDRNAIPGIEKCVRSSDERIRNTYLMAIRHFRMLSDKDSEKNENPEKLLMANMLRFVFAIRHTTGSSWICGDDTLGMEPEIKDQSYPLYGKVSIPRMIIAQFDNFNCLKHLQPLEKKVFPKLEEFIGSNKPKYFFTIYLATFIFCHEVAIQCEDRYRHARQNSMSERYSIPNFVHELQHSANIMLAYWHYYKKDLDPLSMDWRNREKTPLNGLTADQVVFIIQSFEIARDKADELRIIKETNMWEHPLYFVAQMYEKNWTPRDIYNK